MIHELLEKSKGKKNRRSNQGRYVIKFNEMEQCTFYKLGNIKKLLSKRRPDKNCQQNIFLQEISSEQYSQILYV